MSPYQPGRGAADDRADRVEHCRAGVEARPADMANDGRQDDRDDQHLRGVHRDAADYQRRTEPEPVAENIAPRALGDASLDRRAVRRREITEDARRPMP
jgi:hypothetical protein